MLSVERQAMIAQLVKQQQLVKVTDLMERFEVSDMTIRRDLSVLEQRGLIKKIYGGAVLVDTGEGTDQDVNLAVRAAEFTHFKQEIGQCAATFVEADDVILIDAGTTTLEFAKAIRNFAGLVVVTNSLPIASELAERTSSLLFAGGIVRPSTHSTVGPKTKDFLSDLRVSKLFLGASSLSMDQGLMNSNLYESEIKRTMMAAADKVFVLADASKFGSKSYHVFAQWSEVDVLITDQRVTEDSRRRLAERGVQVVAVGEGDSCRGGTTS